MHGRRFLALLLLVFSWPAMARAQIMTLNKVGDKTVVCWRSGLTSSLKDCGVRAAIAQNKSRVAALPSSLPPIKIIPTKSQLS